jgi:ATP-dependent RNA helicase DDX24/MAK5
VNSIKTARRLDGLLRALELNCRTIHAQLQQKQRLKALESFRSAPIGVLVATDVAARGLDLPRVQYVLHYDVARSPQVPFSPPPLSSPNNLQLYIHRSGRTARAGASGISLSIVAPEDGAHHEEICRSFNLLSLPLLRLDVSSNPKVSERVKLAKKARARLPLPVSDPN